MNWIRKLWRRYKVGAEANNFPIKDCGLFGDKLKKPRTLSEAVRAMDYILTDKDKERFQEWDEDKIIAATHHNIGRWIRNNWGLWDESSKLHKFFKSLGIWHADDMSGIILTTYYRKVHNLLPKLDEQIAHYIEYWKKCDTQS